MSRRRAVLVVLGSVAALLIHLLLVRVMAHRHFAHVLLGSGNGVPPLGPALLAIALVLVRFVAIVIVPGALLASLASLAARDA